MLTSTCWHHSPIHCDLGSGTTYIITGATLGKIHRLTSAERLDMMCDVVHDVATGEGWSLHAWAILSNHYHLVTTASEHSLPLNRFVSKVHHLGAKFLNELDGTPNRRVWNQYWDTVITYQRSYLARLHYVHFNPVRHGVCRDAAAYRWCSASQFLTTADRGFRRTVLEMPIDAVNVPDDF